MIKTSTANIPLIALIGPPNSGKTTLFNSLSGKNNKTVNYPGSTVEYSYSDIKTPENLNLKLLDSPGIISLIPASPDEQVTVEALFNNPVYDVPDLVIVTVDASQLSRHLLLVKQLSNSGFRIIIALTMNDILKRKGLMVDSAKLQNELNCSVVKIDGRSGTGINELIKKIDLISGEFKAKPELKRDIVSNNFNDIISYYKEIEQIEKRVTLSIEKERVRLNSINKEIVILNESEDENKNKPDNFTIRLDRILLHRYFGILIFFLIMSAFFTSIYWLAEPLMVLVDEFFSELAVLSANNLGDNLLGSLLSDGIITGAGSVLVFLPQIIILFFILGLLEDTGYLSRGAMLVDKPLSKIGLNGRSFVPMLSGFACAIPAMMAARTISNRRERLLTIFILPLMSCSARLPVYSLLIAFITPISKPWLSGIILASIYLISIVSSIVITGLINKFSKNAFVGNDNSSFILELPTYKIPKPSVILSNTYSSSKAYIQKAGPVIFIFSVILWALTYFPNTNPEIDTTNLQAEEIFMAKSAERVATSYAASAGRFIQPLMEPIGMDWRVGVSLISAFAAREVFVSSLALIFKVTADEESALQQSMLNSMHGAVIESTGEKLFTPATIIGLIVFFIFALQCISTLAVSRKETGSWKIPAFQLILFTSMAYILTFITVNGLRLLGIN